MNSDKSWQKALTAFLAEESPSADTRVLARALASNDSEAEDNSTQAISDLEQALHIEHNIESIGLQPLPPNLKKTLHSISKTPKGNNVIWGKFTANWKKACAIAATVTAITLFGNLNPDTPENNHPTLAEIKQAEQELALAFQYIASAKTKSTLKVNNTLDENLRLRINQHLFKQLNHVKESL